MMNIHLNALPQLTLFFHLSLSQSHDSSFASATIKKKEEKKRKRQKKKNRQTTNLLMNQNESDEDGGMGKKKTNGQESFQVEKVTKNKMQ